MVDKKERFSPKIEIINYFDSLINRVDIDIDECIQTYNEEQILSQLACFTIENRKFKSLKDFYLDYFDSNESSQNNTIEEWPESTNVIDYLNQIRKRTIDELTKAQEESLRLISSRFKSKENQITHDEFRSELFKERFYFQVLYKPVDPKYSVSWIFHLYTFLTDFYMSPTDINLLETFINSSSEEDDDDEEEYIDDEEASDSEFKYIFDEKMVLIGLLQNCFFKNLQTEKFPNRVINVRKQDLMNIQSINFRYTLNKVNLTASKELSNLETLYLHGKIKEEIKIEGLCSLKSVCLKCSSILQITLKSLCAFRAFGLHLNGSVNSDIQSILFDYSHNIEKLGLNVFYLSKFSLDRFVNLKILMIGGEIRDDFNIGLFDNLCNQLEEIVIFCPKIDDKCLTKLFYGHKFPFLQKLILNKSSITKIEKKFLNAFPALQFLEIALTRQLGIIDHDAFSNSKHLNHLNLSNNFIKSIDKKLFSDLTKLETLDLSDNRLETIEENVFSSLQSLESLDLSCNQLSSLDQKSFADLRNLKSLDLENNKLGNFDLVILDNNRKIEEINLSENPLINKEEILNQFVQSRIKLNF